MDRVFQMVSQFYVTNMDSSNVPIEDLVFFIESVLDRDIELPPDDLDTFRQHLAQKKIAHTDIDPCLYAVMENLHRATYNGGYYKLALDKVQSELDSGVSIRSSILITRILEHMLA